MSVRIEVLARKLKCDQQVLALSLFELGIRCRRSGDRVDDATANALLSSTVPHASKPEEEPSKRSSAQALELVHRRLRRGDFGTDLPDLVDAHRAAWARLPLADRLKALYVECEVLDYFGKYAAAADVLKADGQTVIEDLRVVMEAGWPQDDASITLVRRQVWVALAYATITYRTQDYESTMETLQLCANILDPKRLPPRTTLFGTRARLAHSMGQVFRQLHQYDAARASFEQAATLARRRFEQKTPWAEQTELSVGPNLQFSNPDFSEHSLLAMGTIGKCLSLGLGWIEFTVGRLSTAKLLVNAGYTLLRATGDAIHRAYAMLLIGAIERARAGSNEEELAVAIATMENGSKVLMHHPTFRLRASYELALGYYKQESNWSKANLHLDVLKEALGLNAIPVRPDIRLARWRASVLTLESRLRRFEKQYSQAIASAELAITQAKLIKFPATSSEAMIALGEVLLEEGEVEQASKIFSEARDLSVGNPKVGAVCRLHLVRALIREKKFHDAQLVRREAAVLSQHVEHGFVAELSKTVDTELGKAETFFFEIGDAVRRDQEGNQTNTYIEQFELELLIRRRDQYGLEKSEQRRMTQLLKRLAADQPTEEG